MIGYITLGTNDLAKAAEFYDAVLGELGAKRSMETERMVLWASDPAAPTLAVTRPFDGAPATAGNGVMIALVAASPEQVDAVHARALSLGGTDEGPPGPRGDAGFYTGYFRDRDGNKLNVIHMGG